MRVLIVGAGAIGLLLAFRLSQGGVPVTLVGRPIQVEAIHRSGVQIEGRLNGEARVPAETSVSLAADPEVVLLAVKARDVRAAGLEIARAMPRPVPVVALQNGLGIEEELSAGLAAGGWGAPREHVVRAINTYGATEVAPGRVRYAGEGELLLPVEGAAASRAAEALGTAGLTVRRVQDIDVQVWRKLLVNAAINPVTADHNVPNGALRTDPLRGQSLDLLHEALLVARSEGHDFSDEEAEAELWRVVRATAENRSSMLQDIDRGRRTEIDWISGAILAAGARHHLDLPATRRAVERVHRREALGPSQPS